MNRTDLSINLAYIISILFGSILGWKYAFVENFQYFKLLNLSGIVFDLLGVLFVSYAVFVKLSIQQVLATHVSRYTVIFSLAFPASMGAASMVALIFGAKSYESVMIFSAICSVLLFIPMMIIFHSPILEPIYGKTLDAGLRLKLLGAIFIILGFAFQIVASIIDINISM